jgi:quercetin dioxygenase-like cupin family protein
MIHKKMNESRWVDTSYEGVQLCVLRRDQESGGGTILIKFQAGSRFPNHEHPGGEEVYVLRGKALVGGLAVAEGDYLWTPPGGVHDVTAEQETILLVSAPQGIRVLEEPTQT